MEATGVDCDELHRMLYGNWLPWAYWGIKKLPTYITRYVGILTNDPAETVHILHETMLKDKSYFDYDEWLGYPTQFEAEKMVVPSGVHKGEEMWSYDVMKYGRKKEK
jgi:hypothetical protein